MKFELPKVSNEVEVLRRRKFCIKNGPRIVDGGKTNMGVQEIYKFPNGYGASVIRGPYSYGGREGKWELAVFGPDGGIDYSTPVTSDVEGYLEDEEVEALLVKIRALPKRENEPSK